MRAYKRSDDPFKYFRWPSMKRVSEAKYQYDISTCYQNTSPEWKRWKEKRECYCGAKELSKIGADDG